MSETHTILVVDDDPDISHFLERYLELEGFEVSTAANWRTTRKYFESNEPDLVILDLGLPDMSGVDVVPRLRKASDTGIIMLTGSHDKVDKIVVLESGADDYVQKPFDERELLARIRSVLRRRKNVKKKAGSVALFNGWRLDKVACELFDKNAKEVRITQGEYQLLALFVDNANTILSRDEITARLSSRDWVPTDRSVDVMVSKLRKIFGKDGYLIKTVRSKGYMMTASVEYES